MEISDEDFDDLKNCRIGDCLVKLDAEAVDAFRLPQQPIDERLQCGRSSMRECTSCVACVRAVAQGPWNGIP